MLRPQTTTWEIIENQPGVKFLTLTFRHEKLSHAYLFTGPQGVGKRTTANTVAKVILCERRNKDRNHLPCQECRGCRSVDESLHPDCIILEKKTEKKHIAIEDVRLFEQRLRETSFLGSAKVGIIDDAGALSDEAANALLKTLEEPPPTTTIILITTSPHRVPSTLRSRCQTLAFHPFRSDTIVSFLTSKGISKNDAKHFASLSLGRPRYALELFKNPVMFREYQERVRLSFELLRRKRSEKWERLNSYLGKGEFQERVHRAETLTNLLVMIFRDLLMIQVNLPHRLIHSKEKQELEQMAPSYPQTTILAHLHHLFNLKTFLRRNANPEILFEDYFLTMTLYD